MPISGYKARYNNDPEFRARELERSREYKRKHRRPSIGMVRALFPAHTETTSGKDRRKAKERARDRRVRQATPPFADKKAIAAIYLRARMMRKDGWDVHVDHIIPLRGSHVSGLHVHNNLRIVYAEWNVAKGNAYEVG